jgi:hypothetical protein
MFNLCIFKYKVQASLAPLGEGSAVVCRHCWERRLYRGALQMSLPQVGEGKFGVFEAIKINDFTAFPG